MSSSHAAAEATAPAPAPPHPDAGPPDPGPARDAAKGPMVSGLVEKLQLSSGSGPGSSTEAAKTSREASPVRLARKLSSQALPTRSRKNSQDFSPTRNPSVPSIPSAAAVQRAMSAHRPQLLPAAEGTTETARADRSVRSGHSSPAWPTSPRLRSPPPSMTPARHPLGMARKAENEHTSNPALKRAAPGALVDPDPSAAGKEGDAPPHSARSPVSRGASAPSALETVAESSVPTTPAIGPLLNAFLERTIEEAPLESKEGAWDEAMPKSDDDTGKHATADKAELEAKARSGHPAGPSDGLARRSFTNLAGTKGKNGVEPVRTMTVETETVSSIPQLIGGERGLAGRDGAGSVRAKPSSETIRQRKEKRKASRKPPSLHAGTVTSKADIFEAKVASAVDEADSSDSEETFVYESNPPDARKHRHHSRTPSAASLASQHDQFRGKHGVRNGSHGVGGKKSMKFTTSAYSNPDGDHGASDSARGSTRTGNTTPRHHHIGRYSRAGHPSIMDGDSFTPATKPASPRTSAGNLARLSRPNSPRVANGRYPGSPRKGDLYAYDVDDDGADDERAPLVGSVRINRSRHSRRPNGSLRQYSSEEPAEACVSQYGGCIVVTLLILLLCVGVGTFVIALNKSLMDVSIKQIQNVLASEQEIMLDLDVRATNPNLFAISVSDLDVNIFAESPYVGVADARGTHGRRPFPSWIERRLRLISARPLVPRGGVDEGTDPIDDGEPGGQKMLLGRVFEFDSPLLFEASPVKRVPASSVGEIRLPKPGNQTEAGGSERWERVLQHPFDLIVRGVLKYQLPLSSKVRSAKIGSRITVSPQDGTGDGKQAGR